MRTDADGLLAERFAATRDERDDSDWADVLRRVSPPRRRVRLALIAVAAVLAIAVPALALSASVRHLVGLGTQPDYPHARLAVSTPISGNRVARVWTSPSTTGGVCDFVTIDPAGTTTRPVRANGGGSCGERFGGALKWAFSHGGHDLPLIHGRVGTRAPVARVELRWHAGSQRLVYAHRFFVAEAPALHDPPFRRLPFDVVAIGRRGDVLARTRIPTSFLYDDWKRVQPKLHRYRVAHGCDTTVLWRCRSR